MRPSNLLCIAAFLFMAAWHSHSSAQETSVKNDVSGKAGTVLPEISLTGPLEPAERDYLGVPAGESFRVRDIRAELLLIQIFHSG